VPVCCCKQKCLWPVAEKLQKQFRQLKQLDQLEQIEQIKQIAGQITTSLASGKLKWAQEQLYLLYTFIPCKLSKYIRAPRRRASKEEFGAKEATRAHWSRAINGHRLIRGVKQS